MKRVMQRYSRVLSVVALLPFLLVACSTETKVRNEINRNAETVRQGLDTVTRQGGVAEYDPLRVTNKVWVGDSALRIQRGVPLPPRYENGKGITVVSADGMTLPELADVIADQTGIAVRLTDVSARSAASGAMGSGAASAGASAGPMGGQSLSSMGSLGRSAEETMQVAYEGPLSGLLEKISGNFGVSWRYDGASIQVSRFETRVFTVEALPGSQSVSIDMAGSASSGGSGGGGGGGGSGAASAGGASSSTASFSSSARADLRYWDELSAVLTSMLSGTGTIVMSPALGTVTVRTTPDLMQAVSTYIAQENKRLSAQIAVNIAVYNTALLANEDFNVTFSAFIRQIGQSNLSGPTAPASLGSLSGLASANIAIVNQAEGHDSLTQVYQALSAIGNTTRLAQFPMVTLNNRPVSVRVGQDIAYVASVSSDTSTSGSGTSNSVTVETAQIHQGFNVQVAPRILDDGRIMVQYSMTSVDLDSLNSFNSNCGTQSSEDCTQSDSSATLQLPTTTNRVFNQQAVLHSGSTLVIGGVNEKSASENAKGVGDPYNFITGGGRSAQNGQTMMMIAITPQVIEVHRAEQN